ncbi:hypothetical protein NC652_035382 [Populus alba x Populus x berolinensis]|nr:hypothetical protein NC652_035382 [Populus alba x Populus x berolinensis]
MTMLKKLPEEVLNLWNNWEIRGMVLLSLLLQTILIIFGPRKKTTGRILIRILVWSAYLSADVVATVVLGTLARSKGDSSGDVSEKANNSIQAFWAPFLLLHLGGPEKSVLRGVHVLARQLLSLGPEKRWWMINEVWVEMVAYAAAHCPWKEHTHQLRRGGELLTHVFLLMLHLGLSEQYEFNEFKDSFSDLKGVSIPKILLKYVDRYCIFLGVRIK